MIWYSYAKEQPPQKSSLEKYLCICVIPHIKGGSYNQQMKECLYDSTLNQWLVEGEIVVYWTYPLDKPSISFHFAEEEKAIIPSDKGVY